MNFLFCSVGRRGELIKNFKTTLGDKGKIIATDNQNNAPALYYADKQYIVPKINDPKYLEIILEICKKENIRAITTFIDPEIDFLAKNRKEFEKIGVEVLAPYLKTAEICFDKYAFYEYLSSKGIDTVKTYIDVVKFKDDLHESKISFPVFVKPRTGSGSVGARKIDNLKELESVMFKEKGLIIQEFMYGTDLDVDVYVDTISKKAVSAFTKRKLETKIGGANKTISFKDEKLFKLIQEIIPLFEFNGPIDIDFFYQNDKYYISEVNPRFGGAYLHAYGSGVDFVELIINNLKGIENKAEFGNYEEDILMMMYDSVVIKKQAKLAKEFKK